MNAYIRKNTKQPTGLDCTQGTVYISFMVNEDGAVTEAKVLKSLNDPCNRNALEIISNMPKWKPAVLDGKKQKTRMVLPVKFGS